MRMEGKNIKVVDPYPVKTISGNMFRDGKKVSEYVAMTRRWITENIVPKNNLADIERVSEYIPAELSPGVGFETRLDTIRGGRNDCFFSISCSSRDRNKFQEFSNPSNLPAVFRKYDEWEKIYKFAKIWAKEEYPVSKEIVGFWLEFDIPLCGDKPFVPSIFFEPIRITRKEWLADKLYIFKEDIHKDTIDNVYKCIQETPPESSLLALGLMLHRAEDNVRIAIKKFPARYLNQYFKKMNWYPCSREGIKRFVEISKKLSKLCNRVTLHFAVGSDGISKDIQLEFSFNPNKFYLEEGWKKIFHILKQEELCHPDKIRDILTFPGIQYTGEKLSATCAGTQCDLYSHLVRYISHVKLIHGKEITTKAYMGIKHYWLPEKRFRNETKNRQGCFT